MKILFVGLGSIGQRHLRNLLKYYGDRNIEIIAYRHRRLQMTFSDDMNVIQDASLENYYPMTVYTTYKEALLKKPDIVFITTVTSKHIEYAIEAAKIGAALFIEKPLSNTFEGIEQLKRVTRENRCIVQMGFQLRKHICIKETKKIIDQGLIGDIQYAELVFSESLKTMHNYEDYRQTYMAHKELGGGPILNLQIHDIDLILYLFGIPHSVYAAASHNSSLEIDVEDLATVCFRTNRPDFKRILINSRCDFLGKPPMHSIMILGENGRLEIDLLRNTIYVFANDIIEYNYPGFMRNDMFIDELKEFMECVNKKEQPECDLYAGIRSFEIVQAIQESIKLEKEVMISYGEDY